MCKLDKFKYKIFEIGILENIYIEPKIRILCEDVLEIRKHKFFILDGSHFKYCKNGGSITNLRLLPSKFLNSMV